MIFRRSFYFLPMRNTLVVLCLAALGGCASEPVPAAPPAPNVYFEPVAEQGLLHRSERCGERDMLERNLGGVRFFASAHAKSDSSVSIDLIFYPGGEALALKRRQFRLFDPESGVELAISRARVQEKRYDVPVSIYRKEGARATWVTLEAGAAVGATRALELTVPSGTVVLDKQVLEIAPVTFRKIERGERGKGC
jgi:hypothetical protein